MSEGSTRWIELSELRHGAVFETTEGIRGVKSEYRYPNGGCEVVLLASGEYGHFAQGSIAETQGYVHNSTMVREIDVAAIESGMVASAKAWSAALAARDKAIAERDAEIERLRRLFGPVVESAKALVTDYRGQIEAHSRLMRQIREPFHAALNTPDEAVVRALEERDAEIVRLRDENAAIRTEIGAVIKRVDEASEHFRLRRGT